MRRWRERLCYPVHNTTLRATWSISSISTAEDLATFAAAVNSGIRYYGKEVALVDDIGVGGFQGAFSPINEFDGIFIRGLRVNSTEEPAGLFRYTGFNETIKGVVLVDVTISVLSSSKLDP